MSEYIFKCEYDTFNGTFSQKRGEEIVRCKDCKHYTEDEMEYYHYCGCWCEQVEPNGFCNWGGEMSEHMFFQGNLSGKADDASSELSTLSVLCELLGKVDALEHRIEKLEKRCGKIAAFSYGDNDRRIKDHERRIGCIERKLTHKSIEL